ncbi:MAG: hypothetical protein K9M97_13000 [Akkermansiaceae bacterium]|nr:hypothetical protein [Akkermansiaceae bacterium]
MAVSLLPDGGLVATPDAPAAVPVTCEELLAARLNRQRVELTGVSRSQRVAPEAGLAWLALEEGMLGEALAQIGQQLTEGSPITFELRSTGTPRPLSAKVENDLQRIGQEALTNAVRHAGAKQIALALDFRETAVRLAVTDDGCGLAAVPPGTGNGGFGLPGMRERACTIQAELNVRSAPGAGTTIELTVPHV